MSFWPGKGITGGDALVAARLLAGQGIRTMTFLLAKAPELKGDVALNCDRLLQVHVPLTELVSEDGLSVLRDALREADLAIDGIFGTGFTGGARGLAAGAIKLVNLASRGIHPLRVVAIDIPSGLDGESGEVAGEAIRADRTVTMGLPKTGMVRGDGLNCCGRIAVADIGFPSEVIAEVQSDLEMITGDDLAALLPLRVRTSHKGDYGHVLVIAGSPGMTGAAALTSSAALRAGAGLVTLAIPAGLNAILEEKCTEVMTLPLPETAAGTLSPDAAGLILEFCRKASAVALGPGLSRNAETGLLVKELLRNCPVPMVIDADGLNLIAEDPSILKESRPPLILTPHPGEMGRLTGVTKETLRNNREESARLFAREHQLTLVLKGAGTLIASPAGPLWVNVTGNPGMATGGTGDVLTGLIAGFRAQGLPDGDAARLGVFVHGDAGDRAAEKRGQISLLASDLLDEVPAVLKALFPWNVPPSSLSE
ncbi:MAG: NAD(P)H-hydrate dehydratase [PVC group bacterium]